VSAVGAQVNVKGRTTEKRRAGRFKSKATTKRVSMAQAIRRFIPWYLLGVNGISAGCIIEDKRRALQHQWRIPERDLIALGAAGGFPAGYLAMRYAHHKTQKKSFREKYDKAALFSATGWSLIFLGLRRPRLGLKQAPKASSSPLTSSRRPMTPGR
jgi:uncharacterized membrane protein YsdA (DUF1294 family)